MAAIVCACVAFLIVTILKPSISFICLVTLVPEVNNVFSFFFSCCKLFAEVMPGICKENNKLSELETRRTDAKFLLFVRVEIAM